VFVHMYNKYYEYLCCVIFLMPSAKQSTNCTCTNHGAVFELPIMLAS